MWRSIKKKTTHPPTLADFWDVRSVDTEGHMTADKRSGFMFEAEGLDGSFLSDDQREQLDRDWRSLLRLQPGEELQIVFRKRVAFKAWIEKQLHQSFLTKNTYGRRVLLDRLGEQIRQMSHDQPQLLNQKIVICFWTAEPMHGTELERKRRLMQAQLQSFGFPVHALNREAIEHTISASARDLENGENSAAEWPYLRIEAGQIHVDQDQFRALQLRQLPESATELGMIQALTELPYPLDLALRLRCRDLRPIVAKLERKRNLLQAKRGRRSSPAPAVDSQIEQIDDVLRRFADRSESVFDLSLNVGLRLPESFSELHGRALATMARAGGRMDFCEFEETTLGTFDAYLESLPGFCGQNIHQHTVLGSNAIHFLPFFRPARGDRRSIASFETRGSSLYSIDPVAPHLANYNWLVSGTSGAGKSFFVNSLLAQSAVLEPNIFIVDIGGSYNKLTQFLGGRVMSLEPGQGFELSPFFLARAEDPKEERLRRQHIFQIFQEMVRVDGALPAIEIRHLLRAQLDELFDAEELPEKPITALVENLGQVATPEARRLQLLLQPWSRQGFFAQFLDHRAMPAAEENLLTFDLKGLTDFEDLSRVVQLIVCASLWARIRRTGGERFSWIVLDEVAFSLLKSQPEFVDELVSTLRKDYAGAIVVVQDLEKITSNLAGSSILQNTQTKAILQQRGDPRNFAEALSLTSLDQTAIASLRRKKGSYSEIFLLRDGERTIIRHVPSTLEYWLSTTAPEDNLILRQSLSESKDYQKNVMDFVAKRQRSGQ
jgi:hypothetical protein